jgi:NADPH:quinone reductase-like Zn-dependent oxidoreductase
MRAVVIARPGGPEVLEAREVEDPPAPGEGEVLLEVAAAGVNRADTVQRMGRYPPPAGAPPYPGLECSGTILALGTNVPSRWAVGDQVTPRIDDRVPSLLSTGGLLGAVVTRFPFAGLRPAERRRVRGEGGGASGAAAADTGGSLAEGRCRIARGGLHRLVNRVHDQSPLPRRIIPCKNSSIMFSTSASKRTQ